MKSMRMKIRLLLGAAIGGLALASGSGCGMRWPGGEKLVTNFDAKSGSKSRLSDSIVPVRGASADGRIGYLTTSQEKLERARATERPGVGFIKFVGRGPNGGDLYVESDPARPDQIHPRLRDAIDGTP
jgi:hypothetical protein